MPYQFNDFFLRTVFGTGIIILGSFFIQNVHGSYGDLKHLEMSNIHPEVIVTGDFPHEWQTLFAQRVDQVIAEEGMQFVPRKTPLNNGQALLQIRVMAINLAEGSEFAEILLNGTCKGKGAWLFDTQIELWDWVSVTRNPDTPIRAAIWKRYRKFPILKEDISYEDIEGELVRMLKGFIMEYKLANPSFAPEEKGGKIKKMGHPLSGSVK